MMPNVLSHIGVVLILIFVLILYAHFTLPIWFPYGSGFGGGGKSPS